MPQESTSREAGPGTRIIYCFIIHICLQWNIYMRMDISLVRFIRVAGGTFRRWIYPDNPPPPPPRYSNDRYVLQACLSLAGEPGPDWAIRALIGRYWKGNKYVRRLSLFVTAIHFLPAHSINIKHLRHPPSVWRTNVSHGVLVFTILSATYK